MACSKCKENAKKKAQEALKKHFKSKD